MIAEAFLHLCPMSYDNLYTQSGYYSPAVLSVVLEGKIILIDLKYGRIWQKNYWFHFLTLDIIASVSSTLGLISPFCLISSC